MLNIIKMDLYKMFKSKSFYVLNITLVIIVLFMALLMRFTLTVDFERAKESNLSFNMDGGELSTDDPYLTEEGYSTIQNEAREGMSVNEFLMFQYSEFIISVLIAIFIAIFVCSELDSGFIKNIIPLKGSRTNLIVSKNIVISVFIIVQAGVAFISSIISNLIVSGKVTLLDPKELMVYMGIQILLRIVFASLLILISYLFKSKSISMSIGILLAVNIHGLFLGLLDRMVIISNFNPSKLSIINNMSIVRFTSNDYLRVIVLSIVYFLLYNIISTMRLNKMDIN